MQTAEIVLGKKPNVLWIPFSLAILELTNMTMMKAIPGDNQVDIVAECLPEYTVPEQLLIIGQAGELFGRAALPFKEAVHKCCDKRHKYRKDKERYRDNQVQHDCPAPWFNGRQHDRSPIYMETAVPPALAGGTALSLNSFPANVPADSADQEASVSV